MWSLETGPPLRGGEVRKTSWHWEREVILHLPINDAGYTSAKPFYNFQLHSRERPYTSPLFMTPDVDGRAIFEASLMTICFRRLFESSRSALDKPFCPDHYQYMPDLIINRLRRRSANKQGGTVDA